MVIRGRSTSYVKAAAFAPTCRENISGVVGFKLYRLIRLHYSYINAHINYHQMEGCIVPSEVPGVTSREREVFGNIAEDLIAMDIRTRYSYAPFEVYIDDYNPISYLYFLKRHNPQIDLISFTGILSITQLGTKRPDILIHSIAEKVYYEIKPNSGSGRRAGMEKLGILAATYRYFNLPYTAGLLYRQGEIMVASVAGQLSVKLKAELTGPGLIQYTLCLDANATLDLITLAALLRYVIQRMNEQAGRPTFRPVDLEPAFAREGALANLARTLGLVMVSGAAAVGWRYFWRAVARRFATRAATAGILAAADGPIPVGDLIAAGMAVWTIIDIIRLSSVLWADAARIAREEA